MSLAEQYLREDGRYEFAMRYASKTGAAFEGDYRPGVTLTEKLIIAGCIVAFLLGIAFVILSAMAPF